MTAGIHIIIVTHDSQEVLPLCLAHLAAQTVEITSTVIVDSGSADRQYLECCRKADNIKLVKTGNIGFGRANNLGFSLVRNLEGIVVFLNPDTFLPPGFLAKVLDVMDGKKKIGILSGKLLGYDLGKNRATGKIDSTGIFRKWYGRWYDRGMGEKDRGRYNKKNTLPAVCGALMICPVEVLRKYGEEVFDPLFFLYKEDIELSLRLHRDGYDLVYEPCLVAFHCRGWRRDRRKIPFHLRLMASKNEIQLYRKHPSPYILWAITKYLLVRFCRL